MDFLKFHSPHTVAAFEDDLKLKQRKATAEEVRSYTAFQKATDKKAKRHLLLAALESEDADTLTYLLSADPDPDLAVDYGRTTALQWVLKRYDTLKDPWLLDVCLAAGCSLTKLDGDGKTAKGLAEERGLTELVEATLKRLNPQNGLLEFVKG